MKIKSVSNLVFLFAFLFLSSCMHVQKVLTIPEKYINPIENIDLKLGDDTEFSDSPWYVWSDRSNNPVFSSRDCSKQVAKLGFGEECAVIRIYESKLLLANKDDIVDGRLVSGKKPLGWVDADNLLLWDVCLKTEQSKFDKKAILANNSNTSSPGEMGNDLYFYDGPRLDHDSIDTGHGYFQVYFVYKSTEDFLLLGEGWGISNPQFSKSIYGWIPKSNCVQWNTNVALELNWHPDAVKERKESGTPVRVWENRSDANSMNLDGQIIFEEEPFYSQRYPGFWNRFFILEEDTNSVNFIFNQPIKVGFCDLIKKSEEENGGIDDIMPEVQRSIFSGTHEIYREGYTVFKADGITYPQYQPVIFVEQNILNQMSYFITILSRAEGSLSDLRIAFYYIFLDFACFVRGEECEIGKDNLTLLEKEAITNAEDEKIGDLLYRIFGCETKKEWKDLTVADIKDPDKFFDGQILVMRKEFGDTESYLQNIKDERDDYNGRIPTGKTTFTWWWIPFDVFPHDSKLDDVSLDGLYAR